MEIRFLFSPHTEELNIELILSTKESDLGGKCEGGRVQARSAVARASHLSTVLTQSLSLSLSGTFT